MNITLEINSTHLGKQQRYDFKLMRIISLPYPNYLNNFQKQEAENSMTSGTQEIKNIT